MSSRTILSFSDDAARAIRDAFDGMPDKDGETLALVYMFMFKDPDGRMHPGFRPGYVATAWPMTSVSSEWLTAHLPDGREVRFLPRTDWGVDGAFAVDLLDVAYPTFSVTRN